MATKTKTNMVGLRLSDETVRELYFLGVLGGQASPAKVVTEWIHLAAEAVKAKALAMNPALAEDQDVLLNHGTILSREEQWAFRAVREALT